MVHSKIFVLTDLNPPYEQNLSIYEVKLIMFIFSSIQADWYATKHLIVTMGSDFNYVQAHMFYKELDKLIKYVNARVGYWVWHFLVLLLCVLCEYSFLLFYLDVNFVL